MKDQLLLLAVAGLTLVLGACSTVIVPQAESYSITQGSLWDVVSEDGVVHYQALVDSPFLIEREYEEIKGKSPDSHPEEFPREEDRLAYWLNAYNISAIYGVVKNYPIKSVRDHQPFSLFSLIPGGGFFAAQKFSYGGEKMSLYRLENKIIRKRFKDPRIHFGLNCASRSCPNLSPKPFRGSSLERQLDRLTRDFINSPKGVQINHEAQEIRVSAIFDWYEEDFPDGILNYVAGYYENREALKRARELGYELKFLSYDWSLNGPRGI